MNPDRAKILHLSYSDSGGAGKAALRLCQAQRAAGWDAHLLVLNKTGDSAAVEQFQPGGGLPAKILREVRIRLARRRSRRPGCRAIQADYPFSSCDSPYRGDLEQHLHRADIIHLHWVAGLLHLPTLLRPALATKPIIWTLHDFTPITGGCHYPAACAKFATGCNRCPILGSSQLRDRSSTGWQLRRKIFAAIGCRLQFTAPSAWLVAKAEKSGVLNGQRFHLLRNTLDLECFQPHQRSTCRRLLNLPQDRRIVLFVADKANDRRKGGDRIEEVVGDIRSRINCHFASVGSGSGFPGLTDYTPFGAIRDDRLLAMIYAAADVFLLPSRDDNLPNTAIEALASGTPVVCFASGGAPELLQQPTSGRVVPPGDVAAMAQAAVDIMAETTADDHHRSSRRAAVEAMIAPASVLEACRKIYDSAGEIGHQGTEGVPHRSEPVEGCSS